MTMWVPGVQTLAVGRVPEPLPPRSCTSMDTGKFWPFLILSGDWPWSIIPLLRTALAKRPDHNVCWTNLVVALGTLGDLAGAREAAAEAERAGVLLDPALLKTIGAGEGEVE